MLIKRFKNIDTVQKIHYAIIVTYSHICMGTFTQTLKGLFSVFFQVNISSICVHFICLTYLCVNFMYIRIFTVSLTSLSKTYTE